MLWLWGSLRPQFGQLQIRLEKVHPDASWLSQKAHEMVNHVMLVDLRGMVQLSVKFPTLQLPGDRTIKVFGPDGRETPVAACTLEMPGIFQSSLSLAYAKGVDPIIAIAMNIIPLYMIEA